MNKETQQNELVDLTRKVLDSSIEDMDHETLVRLREARNKAVLVSKTGPSTNRNWWMPLGGFAVTAALVALSLSLWVVKPDSPMLEHFEDIAVLSDKEDLDLYDDLEFYQWLDDEKQSQS